MLNAEIQPREVLTGVLQKEIINLGGGTSDYDELNNKPSINGITLEGNKTTEDLGIVTSEYIDQKIADLVNSAPETLDTLGEVTIAIQKNSNNIEALNNTIGDINTTLESILGV